MRKKKSSFMRQSMYILAGVCLFILVSYILNYFVIQNLYKKESIKLRVELFDEFVREADNAQNDIERILISAGSNAAVLDYMKSDNLADRWDRLSQINQISATLLELDSNIVAVCMYDEDNNLIAMNGSKYAKIPESMWKENELFSNKVAVSDDDGIYYYAMSPVLERRKDGYHQVGSIALLIRNNSIQNICDFAISNYQKDGVYFAIQDRTGKAVAQSGKSEVYETYLQSDEKKEKYLYFEEQLDMSDWKVLFLTNKDTYMSYMKYAQTINLITYAVTILAQIWMCYMMYSHVMVPLNKQIHFVSNYTKDMSRRIEINDNYEFGELEAELNEMLDGIERLNREILAEKERNQQLEYEKKQTEIVAYKNQINPHFLHNTLECIRGMALYKGEREIAKLAAAMSRMFQYNIRGGEIVTVKQMLRSIEDYSVIIEYRFMGKTQMKISADTSVEECQIPKMLIQPLVENAVRHGTQQRIDGGKIELLVCDNGDTMKIIVHDTGIGMSPEVIKKQRDKFEMYRHESGNHIPNKEIGIANVARRLWLFYQDDYEVQIESQENVGTTFVLIVPKMLQAENEEGRV